MTAQDIIDYARDTMLGFGLGFLPTNAELLRRLSEEIRRLLEELVLIDNLALDLPGDSSKSVDVSVYAVSYALPLAPDPVFWRIRNFTVTYSTGPDRAAERVNASYRNRVPQFFPSYYVQAGSFFPIDNGSTRIYGWTSAATVELDYITQPAELAAGTDTVASPDEAKAYLGHFLAHYMGVRGKVAQQTLAEIKGLRDGEKNRLMALAGAVPGVRSS